MLALKCRDAAEIRPNEYETATRLSDMKYDNGMGMCGGSNDGKWPELASNNRAQAGKRTICSIVGLIASIRLEDINHILPHTILVVN